MRVAMVCPSMAASLETPNPGVPAIAERKAGARRSWDSFEARQRAGLGEAHSGIPTVPAIDLGPQLLQGR